MVRCVGGLWRAYTCCTTHLLRNTLYSNQHLIIQSTHYHHHYQINTSYIKSTHHHHHYQINTSYITSPPPSKGPFELLRELVVAVGDSEKGKHSHLSSLLQERLALRANKEDHDKLRSEVALLRDENSKLREKLRAMETKLQRIQLESQTPLPSPDKRGGSMSGEGSGGGDATTSKAPAGG